MYYLVLELLYFMKMLGRIIQSSSSTRPGELRAADVRQARGAAAPVLRAAVVSGAHLHRVQDDTRSRRTRRRRTGRAGGPRGTRRRRPHAQPRGRHLGRQDEDRQRAARREDDEPRAQARAPRHQRAARGGRRGGRTAGEWSGAVVRQLSGAVVRQVSGSGRPYDR